MKVVRETRASRSSVSSDFGSTPPSVECDVLLLLFFFFTLLLT